MARQATANCYVAAATTRSPIIRLNMAHYKILFRLEQDEDGYPPVDVEGIWAESDDESVFVIDNIPFFTREATLGDSIEAVKENGELFYLRTRSKSSNSLIRVILFDGNDPTDLRNELLNLGCSTELSHLNALIAVNVPIEVRIDSVRALLQKGCEEDHWDYEEAILRQ